MIAICACIHLASTPGPLTFEIKIGGPGSRWHVTLDTHRRTLIGRGNFITMAFDLQ